MKFTGVLCKYRPMFVGKIPKFPGNVLTGKHRWVPPVRRLDKLNALDQIAEEENVIKHLKAPYITIEEERAYLNHVNRVVPEYVDDYLFKKIEKPLQQKYAVDFLSCLDTKRNFEEFD